MGRGQVMVTTATSANSPVVPIGIFLKRLSCTSKEAPGTSIPLNTQSITTRGFFHAG
jgi:hypothetical protein